MSIKFKDLIKKILTESIEQIDPRVRQFAKSKGYTIEAFHGSEEKELTEISKTRTSYGLFFSPDPTTSSGYTHNNGKVYHVLLHAPEDKILDLTEDKIRYEFINEYMGSGHVSIISKRYQDDSEELDQNTIVDTIMDSLKTHSEIYEFLINKYPPEDGEDPIEWLSFYVESDAYSLIDEPIIWKLFEDDYIKVDEEANHILNSYGSQDFYWNYQNDVLKTANAQGYFLVIFDDPATPYTGGESISYVVFNPNNIKLADTQTFDSQGQEIPLEKRFNKNVSDFRY